MLLNSAAVDEDEDDNVDAIRRRRNEYKDSGGGSACAKESRGTLRGYLVVREHQLPQPAINFAQNLQSVQN